MRVTDRMMFDNANTNIAAGRNKVQTAMQEASSGMRVTHPGDDPASAGLIVRSRQVLQRLEAIGTNAGRTNDELGVADSALQNMGNVVTRIRELTVQMGNDSYSATDRRNAAVEVDQLTRQVVMLMNTDVNGRYLFAGTNDASPPFDAAGNYSGDTNVRQVEVAPGLLENSSIRGDVAVKGAGGGVDLFAILQTLQTALNANDGTGVRSALPQLDTATRQLTDAMASVGSMMNSFDVAKSLAAAGHDDATKSMAHEQEVDTFESATKLALANHALEVALTASANGFRMSLMNKLG
ncbi:MAG TPA: flagellar hook-associated protein FlgL [Polyangia bacterium]|nr:flagellar hook-associated protein FlgL [Polyangia bacterium]